MQLFGRSEAIETLTHRLAENRLVTIVGPGGIGKTAVALAVADRMRPGLRDGVCFVDLAPLADARLVSTAVASALGLGVVSEDPVPSLVALLRDRDTLIVLDNCEHVIESAALLAETIARSTGARLRILATSREALRVQGERVLRLAPLDLPKVDEQLSATIAMTYPAVQLFVERAAMCLGEYSLTDVDAPAVAQAKRIAWDVTNDERARGDALSLCQVLVQVACPVGLMVGDLSAVEGFVAELIGTSERYQWHFWRVFGACFRSVLTVQRGDIAAGLPLLEEALKGLRGIDFGVHYLYFLCQYATALSLAGRGDQPLAAAAPAESVAGPTPHPNTVMAAKAGHPRLALLGICHWNPSRTRGK